MLIGLYLIVVIAILITVVYKSKKTFHMLQQNLYNENNRYVKWILKNPKLFLDLDLLILGVTILGAFLFYQFQFSTIINCILITILCLIQTKLWDNRRKNDQNKKPFVITKRIKRLFVTVGIIYIIPAILLILKINNTQFIWLMILLLTIFLYINPLILYIANVINKPINKLEYLYYLNKAKNKLKQMSDLKVVGITGSYGKTSSKNILADILNIKYNALPTPKSLNTPLGLMITINNHLDKFNDIFIAEMGAYVRGEIKGMCSFVKPKYGILTNIGTAHLETFGSQENIAKGKFELIEALPYDGLAVLNKDDKIQVNYPLKNKVSKVWISIDEPSDYQALNISYSNKGTSFDVYIKKIDKTYNFETKLLGNHNVYNILAGIALGDHFNIEITELQKSVKTIKPIEHRLELKKLGNFYQIDDAYNSNPVGAKNALDVLKMMPGVKIVVTPGMVELGEKEQEYNQSFGEQIAKIADYAVLIGEKRTMPIKRGLISAGYSEEKIVIYNDVVEAYNFIRSIATNEEVYALFENDLPDIYNE